MDTIEREQFIKTLSFKLAHYVIREKDNYVSSTIGFRDFSTEKDYLTQLELTIHQVRQAIDKKYLEKHLIEFCKGDLDCINRLKKFYSKPNWFDQMVYELVRYEEDYKNLKKLSKGWLCEIDDKFSNQVESKIKYIEEMMEAFSFKAAIHDLDLLYKTIDPESKPRERRIKINDMLASLGVFEVSPFKPYEQHKIDCELSGENAKQEIDKKIYEYFKPAKTKKNIPFLSSFLKTQGVQQSVIEEIKVKSGNFSKK